MVLYAICGANINCIILQGNNEVLFSFNDVVKLIFNKADWSSEVKSRKKYNYAKLLQNFISFLKTVVNDGIPTFYFTKRGINYFINDIILKHNYPDNNLFEMFRAWTANQERIKVSFLKKHFKKTKQRFFCLHLLYHVRNACFCSSFTMYSSDIFYVRYSDIDYSFNMMSHLGVTKPLATVGKRLTLNAENRNIEDEVNTLTPCRWTYLWENICKTHGSNSVV